MTPSNPTRVAPRVAFLPEAGREEQLDRWGLSTSARWEEVERRPPSDYAEDERTWDELDDEERAWGELGFIVEGGWSPVSIKGGQYDNGGLTSHRGVLHPDEYVDEASLQVIVECELGFSYEELHSVYRTGGRISVDKRELRGRIDARLLALSCSGANMDVFGRVTGLNPSTVDRALARARAAETMPV